MPQVEDIIRRELEVPVEPARAWAALVEPDLLARWYGRPTAPFEAGAEVTLVFQADAGEERARARVLEVREGRSVTYRWVPGTAAQWGDLLDRDAPFDELPTTLVELRVEAMDDPRTSRIRVLEAGFAALPREVAAAMAAGNTGGWEYCLGRLEGVLGAGVAAG
ncbi:MAG: Aha1 domain superfamily [Thermoleophilia bacterium]|nr:Aha1 domain superfamily [Thermoleophilia bacterium]